MKSQPLHKEASKHATQAKALKLAAMKRIRAAYEKASKQGLVKTSEISSL